MLRLFNSFYHKALKEAGKKFLAFFMLTIEVNLPRYLATKVSDCKRFNYFIITV